MRPNSLYLLMPSERWGEICLLHWLKRFAGDGSVEICQHVADFYCHGVSNRKSKVTRL